MHRNSVFGLQNMTHSRNKAQEIAKQNFVLHPEIMNVIKEFQSDGSSDRTYAVYFTDTNDGFAMLKQDTIIIYSIFEKSPICQKCKLQRFINH